MKRKQAASSRGRRLRRYFAFALGGGALLVLTVYWAVHRFEWAGPLVANSLRALVGAEAVTQLEEIVYAVEDRVRRLAQRGERPKAHWTVPPTQSASLPPTPPSAQGSGLSELPPSLPPFRPKNVGPFDTGWSAPGDGQWVPIVDPRYPAREPHLFKTLIHSDRNRSWAEVFVVAVDLRRTRLHLMPGSREPKATEKEAENVERPGKIPEAHHHDLLGAFNGGFMTEHGNYGMMLGGVIYVKARGGVCTLAAYKDDSLRIGPWEELEQSLPNMLWYRQAPTCMYTHGELHPLLKSGFAGKWGATLDGDTVIRRSAVGLNRERTILYVGISNHTTARAMADGLHHAGASDVAQMDVNWSYPKFVLFEPKAGDPTRKAVALAEGFEFSEDEYIRKRSRRDFFYLMPLTAKSAP